jgi:hypothetical protein
MATTTSIGWKSSWLSQNDISAVSLGRLALVTAPEGAL